MTKSEGICRIDSVTIGELSINLLAGEVVTTKFAFCNSSTGVRYGAGSKYGDYSTETLEKMKAFLDSVEKDILTTLFSEGTTTSSVEAFSDSQPDGVPGL
jgi:hypothetical protein